MSTKKIFKTQLCIPLIATFLLFGCSPKSETAYLAPEKRDKSVKDTDGTAYFDPRVDILFVIDDSYSMATHQRNLINNIQQFTSTFVKNSALNYNIGVITTDMTDPRRSGRLSGNPRFINRQTPGAEGLLANNLNVGVDGSGFEYHMSAAMTALTPPLSTTVNQGFLRDDATIVLIFLTDTNDNGSIRPDDLYNELLKIKNGNKKKIMGFGAIIPSSFPETPTCSRDSEGSPAAIERFLGLVSNSSNNVLNLCDSDFGRTLADFANQIVESVGSTIYLSRQPDINSIRVLYGSIELPRDFHKGWYFDAAENAVRLGDQIDWSVQPEGTQVIVNYKEARGR